MDDVNPPGPAGPTDITDDLVRREAKKATVWLGIAAIFALVVLLAQPIMLIIGGIVFAAMIDGGQRLLARVLPWIPRGLRITIVLLGTFAFLVWLVIFAGGQIAAQAAQLPEVIQRQLTNLSLWAQSHGISVQNLDLQSIASQVLGSVGQVTRALGGIFGGFTTAFLIFILSIYFVLEPDLYRRGVAWMLPEVSRRHWEGTALRMGKSLRMLLFGRLIGMAVEGVATWALLAWWGVPMAALLGLLTGLLAFLPNIGAPISGALMIMVGFSGGTEMGLFCIAVYLVVQTVDGNIIVPMVAKRTVDLAPALVLGAQLMFGLLFGILGLMLADPIVAMLKIALERQAERNDANRAEA
ncbi:AI-2E family transporter [Novosphingobium jiangmenense]|uniref:AI-2E family transporter n=1 Tax=Novosphingobium jiangmenense TaxID=2791981 RepID=A0ABS0HE11_9SPHN|nr:AI-2E family transporter [Novosphingobium jiangmenense]MBF9150509.1 AI-2E family transporter [Novosphingobium jiangmenense]